MPKAGSGRTLAPCWAGSWTARGGWDTQVLSVFAALERAPCIFYLHNWGFEEEFYFFFVLMGVECPRDFANSSSDPGTAGECTASATGSSHTADTRTFWGDGPPAARGECPRTCLHVQRWAHGPPTSVPFPRRVTHVPLCPLCSTELSCPRRESPEKDALRPRWAFSLCWSWAQKVSGQLLGAGEVATASEFPPTNPTSSKTQIQPVTAKRLLLLLVKVRGGH